MTDRTTKNTFENTPPVGTMTYTGMERIVLPLPPQNAQEYKFEMDLYARFMRHLRNVPNSRMEIKILSAIQFTADMMDVGDALVAKTLADLGLRAPRKAFPTSFLDFVDKSLMRTNWDTGSAQASVIKLREFWDKIGEDRFAHVMAGRYPVYGEGVFVDA